MLPRLVGHRLHGERPAGAPASMRLREMAELPRAQAGWLLLGERPREESRWGWSAGSGAL